MECRSCGKTHRELPEGIVPYKRHGLNSLCEIAEATETQYTCETSTWLRIRLWFAWFFWYAQNIMEGLIAAEQIPATFYPGHSLRRRTASFVRLVANSGNWEQHRSAMKAVHSFSSGIPRLINRACTQSLVYAYQNRRAIIDDRMVQLVLEGEVS